jgi:preprotein translocase subunit YajC
MPRIMGITDLAVTSSSSGSKGFNPTTLILIVVVVVAFYMLLIRPQRRKAAAAQQNQNTVAPGARVRTTAGMYATVVAVDGDDVILEVAPDIEVRYMKRSIMDVVSPGTEETEEEAEVPVDETDTDYYAEPEDTEAAHDDTETAPDAAEETAYEQATGTSKKD